MKLGFLASGRGSNMQAVIDACASGQLPAKPCVVISNNSGSGAIVRAQRAVIPWAHLSSVTHPDPDALDRAMCDTLYEHGAELVVLAGYMKRVGPRTLDAYAGRVINIHPALLPRFGGAGMYGARVHASVLAAGARETGVTIHVVDAEYDHGTILAQRRVPVLEGDEPETLAQRVLVQEHALLVETIGRIARGEIALPGRAEVDK
ncbi:MAG: phosphoribosylglycinamide formyltransferase [Anaerolineae bacterium]|nr:phosphoribosylglycinamide formyltransferase [Anaerolineae bacterium]